MKIWLTAQIIEMDEEISKMEELKLPHLREKAYYKKRAFQKTLNELIFKSR